MSDERAEVVGASGLEGGPRVGGEPPGSARAWAGTSLAALVVAVALFAWMQRLADATAWGWSVEQAHRAGLEPPGSGALLVDVAFIVAYATFVVAVARAIRAYIAAAPRIDNESPVGTRRQAFGPSSRFASLGAALVLAAALADLCEDLLTWRHGHGRGTAWMGAVYAAGWTKWILLAVGAVFVVLALVSFGMRRRIIKGGDQAASLWNGRRAGPRREVGTAEPAARPQFEDPGPGGRTGVSLSGGGIRSASFSLGALQAIRRSKLDDVEYVTSVSGGGYMAAAWAAASGGDRAPFEPGGAEERHVRNHTNYMVSSFPVVLGALATLVGGLALNLVLLFLAGSSIVRPVGWGLGAIHPELRARQPIVRIESSGTLEVAGECKASSGAAASTSTGVDGVAPEDCVRKLTAAEVARLGTCESCPKDWEKQTLYLVPMRWAPGKAPRVSVAPCVREAPKALVPGASPRRCAPRRSGEEAAGDGAARIDATASEGSQDLVVVRPAVVLDSGLSLAILRQPSVAVAPSVLAPDGQLPSPTDPDLEPSLSVARQPRLRTGRVNPVALTSTNPEALDARLDAGLLVADQPILAQHSGTTGQPDVTFPLWMWLASAAVAAAAVVATTFDRPLARVVGARGVAGPALTLGAVAVFSMFIALPWLVQSVPDWLAALPGVDDTSTGWKAALGFAVAAAAAVGKYLAPSYKRIRKVAGSRIGKHLADLVLGLGTVGLLAVALAYLLGIAAANGPHGRLEALVEAPLPSWTDLQRWLLGIALLAAASLLPAMAWSLQGYYRSRLRAGYLRPPVHGAEGRQLTLRNATLKLDSAGTRESEWVICTTANLRNAGVTAPGRRAGSFTFSKTWIGGPEAGWIATGDYLDRLSRARERELSLANLIAISGAAFSPAMGKDSQGWRGRLFAIANLRLGSWVGSPIAVSQASPRKGRHRGFGALDHPGALWYLREVLGIYDVGASYLYLTDGGHWENLGLVELLRRRCTDIWMISAAGDGTRSFETFAQALALARTELGITFDDMELEGLRPGAKPDEKAPRQLLRGGSAVATAKDAFETVRFRYPVAAGQPPIEGKIRVIEAALLGDLPWDVHAYAEANPDFPDIPTGYQFMDERDFEAYRMLGYTQASRALDDAGLWPPDAGPSSDGGTATTTTSAARTVAPPRVVRTRTTRWRRNP